MAENPQFFAKIGYISMKLDLPNNKTRIVIKGLNRVNVLSYIEE